MIGIVAIAEVCNWNRFHNRKQMGSYTGCCPGEHSSAGKRLVGSIDRMGNGRVRALLVEAVWRFLLWQPGWKAAARMKVRQRLGWRHKPVLVHGHRGQLGRHDSVGDFIHGALAGLVRSRVSG